MRIFLGRKNFPQEFFGPQKQKSLVTFSWGLALDSHRFFSGHHGFPSHVPSRHVCPPRWQLDTTPLATTRGAGGPSTGFPVSSREDLNDATVLPMSEESLSRKRRGWCRGGWLALAPKVRWGRLSISGIHTTNVWRECDLI